MTNINRITINSSFDELSRLLQEGFDKLYKEELAMAMVKQKSKQIKTKSKRWK